jgi:hypothetical protein
MYEKQSVCIYSTTMTYFMHPALDANYLRLSKTRAFYSLFSLGRGVTRAGDLMHLFLCWPGMVPNQRQLFIIVSD